MYTNIDNLSRLLSAGIADRPPINTKLRFLADLPLMIRLDDIIVLVVLLHEVVVLLYRSGIYRVGMCSVSISGAI